MFVSLRMAVASAYSASSDPECMERLASSTQQSFWDGWREVASAVASPRILTKCLWSVYRVVYMCVITKYGTLYCVNS